MQKISMHTAERVKYFIDIQGAFQGRFRSDFLLDGLYSAPCSGAARRLKNRNSKAYAKGKEPLREWANFS